MEKWWKHDSRDRFYDLLYVIGMKACISFYDKIIFLTFSWKSFSSLNCLLKTKMNFWYEQNFIMGDFWRSKHPKKCSPHFLWEPIDDLSLQNKNLMDDVSEQRANLLKSSRYRVFNVYLSWLQGSSNTSIFLKLVYWFPTTYVLIW